MFGLFVDSFEDPRFADVPMVKSKMVERERERDINTTYFHACVKNRGMRNSISALRVERWMEDFAKIKQGIVNFFTHHFSVPETYRPTMGDIDFIHISNLDNVMLSALFLVSKIALVVSSVDGNESPRPDGFNFTFFIRF